MLSHPLLELELDLLTYTCAARVQTLTSRAMTSKLLPNPCLDFIHPHRTTLSPDRPTDSNYLSPASVGAARQSLRAVGLPQVSRTGASRLDSRLSSGVTFAIPTEYFNSLLPPHLVFRTTNHNHLFLQDDEDEGAAQFPAKHFDEAGEELSKHRDEHEAEKNFFYDDDDDEDDNEGSWEENHL